MPLVFKVGITTPSQGSENKLDMARMQDGVDIGDACTTISWIGFPGGVRGATCFQKWVSLLPPEAPRIRHDQNTRGRTF